jgi:glycosyltransferase involved in cell wall biosynthesis
MPVFSVVVPLHNKEPHVARALRSILDQSGQDLEVIVVDDASTDGSLEEVQKFDDARIRLLRRATPGPGGYAARNLGIHEARGEWVAFLDADDEWLPDHLARYGLLIARFPESAVLGCGWEVHNPAGLFAEWYPDPYSARWRGAAAHVLDFNGYLRAELEGSRPICTSVACIRRSVLLAAGGFPDGRTKRGGDVDTWLRCINHAGSLAWSPHIGGIYHRDAVNMVTRTEVFTAACERETVKRLLPGQPRSTRRLLKRFVNRRTVGAWKQVAQSGAPRFNLVGKLYWSADPVRGMFWCAISSLPPSVYLAFSAATKAAKRARRYTVRWVGRQPPATLARMARTSLLRLLPRPAGEGEVRAEPVYLSAGDSATFFGYHDKTPVSRDGARILAMSTAAGATPSGPGSAPLVLGYFDVTEEGEVAGGFTPFGDTLAWCWQQGCMLQWHPLNPNRHVVFNSLRVGAYGSTVMDVHERRVVRDYPAPIYSLDPSGRLATSVNFARLERLRPGYGYGRIPDGTEGIAAPADEGLFLLDMGTGELELAVSLATLAAEVETARGEHYVNHLTFSDDGSRLVFIHLWDDGESRAGRLCALDLSTREHTVVETDRTVSHYCWRDERQLLATTRARAGTWHYTLYDVVAGTRRDLTLPLSGDGHPMFHPRDAATIVTDTYPDRRREQSLLIADIDTGTVQVLARFRSPFRYRGPSRCDLHPRWDREGAYIVVDTTHRGRREMALIRQPSARPSRQQDP